MDKSWRLHELIRAHVLKVLQEFKEVSKAARELGVTRATVYNYIERYNLKQEWRDASGDTPPQSPNP